MHSLFLPTTHAHTYGLHTYRAPCTHTYMYAYIQTLKREMAALKQQSADRVLATLAASASNLLMRVFKEWCHFRIQARIHSLEDRLVVASRELEDEKSLLEAASNPILAKLRLLFQEPSVQARFTRERARQQQKLTHPITKPHTYKPNSYPSSLSTLAAGVQELGLLYWGSGRDKID